MVQFENTQQPNSDPLSLVVEEELPVYEVLPGSYDLGMVIVCDHASNYLPPEYGSLGLPSEEFERHIAYDIGAARVTRLMSESLGVPAVLSNFSRLLIDPNRALDDPTLIMQLSDGAIIPGNAHISHEEREKRINRFYNPYHLAVEQALEACIEHGRPPSILSLHSFTQEWHGSLRPWEAGILWDEDGRLVKPLLECLRMETDFNIGDNEPYSGKLKGDSMYCHGTRKGLSHALVEIRQDQIRDDEGQHEWAGRLSDIMTRIMADPERAKELSKIHK